MNPFALLVIAVPFVWVIYDVLALINGTLEEIRQELRAIRKGEK